ncbi:MAG: UDP-N-acetylmuramoyl-L-alanyl-D-glutamate--2,6-diaminopimelate ligase [Clostridia bacterium]|nr:UDP-N-acetylmuramoyl-L-alanyl-D-glutamate--2,6-diaminopimelate ligase [Clostridia bacterium]
MRLFQLLSEIPVSSAYGFDGYDRDIPGVCNDTRKLKKGDAFFALPGSKTDGANMIPDAVKKGASVIFTQHTGPSFIQEGVPVFITEDPRAAAAAAWQIYYHHPERRLLMNGVTGTNGKSTVTHMIYRILRDHGINAGLIGTLGYFFGDVSGRTDNTTPVPEELYRILHDFEKGGAVAAVTEVSSHALAQERLYGVGFRTAVFTNLTPEHLDYHGTMEEYFNAKAKLFPAAEVSVINRDDEYSRRIAWKAKDDVIFYGLSPDCDIKAKQITLSSDSVSFTLEPSGTRFHIPVVGEYNVKNALAATAAASVYGISADEAAESLSRFHSVAGRLEKLDTGTDFSVYIDYAHTPDALLQSLLTLRRSVITDDGGQSPRLIAVFGCGGDRDRTKRPVMGRIAVENADTVILTSDNSRSEDPEDIIDEIDSGIADKSRRIRITDRRSAIAYAVETAKAGDVVLLAGKGHEDYETDRSGTHRFSEREAVFDSIKKKG